MDRVTTIRSMFPASGRGLEIGPSYNPLFPKSEGFEIDTVDHASADDLRAKYASEPNVDCSRIEEVDYVWDGRPLGDVIGRGNCYDYVVASHVIEHTPNLLGFVNECSNLLTSNGVLFLAVPDKRRCFDIFRPLSSTGSVLQAHAEGRTRHNPAVAFDHAAYMATLNGSSGWMENSFGSFELTHSLSLAQSLHERSLTSADYYDFHAWTFCPSSFRLLIKELNEIEALDLREQSFLVTPSIEFFVTLSRSGQGCELTRKALLLQIQNELHEFPAREESAAPTALDTEALWTQLRSNTMAAQVNYELLKAAEAEALAAREATRAAEARVTALEHSLSWRLTAPMRLIARGLRG